MALVADTGAIIAIYDSRDANHRRVRDAIEAETGVIVVSAAILAEVDYMLRTNLGIAAELRFLEAFTVGAFALEPFTMADLEHCRGLLSSYRKLDLGLCDVAVIATADRLGINRILTVDERDFRVVRSARGTPFTLVPGDTA